MPENYVEGSTVNCVLAFQGMNRKLQNWMKLDILLPLKMYTIVIIYLGISGIFTVETFG